MEIVIIAAMADNRVIGHQQAIPWHLPGEQLRFKAITWGHPLIMGRKTFESIGRALPGRRNIVVSRAAAYLAPGCEVASSLEAALATCGASAKVFVIGGGEIYQQALSLADSLILTTVPRTVAGDTFFPAFESDFIRVDSEVVVGPEPYRIDYYRRRRPQPAGDTQAGA